MKRNIIVPVAGQNFFWDDLTTEGKTQALKDFPELEDELEKEELEELLP